MSQETFENKYNINNNSLITENRYNLLIPNSELEKRNCLSEGNDIAEKDEKEDNKKKNIFSENNNDIINSPAFNNGNKKQNRINDLINKKEIIDKDINNINIKPKTEDKNNNINSNTKKEE